MTATMSCESRTMACSRPSLRRRRMAASSRVLARPSLVEPEHRRGEERPQRDAERDRRRPPIPSPRVFGRPAARPEGFRAPMPAGQRRCQAPRAPPGPGPQRPGRASRPAPTSASRRRAAPPRPDASAEAVEQRVGDLRPHPVAGLVGTAGVRARRWRRARRGAPRPRSRRRRRPCPSSAEHVHDPGAPTPRVPLGGRGAARSA